MEALWIMLIPLIWLFVAKYWLRTTFNWKEFAISFVAVALITTATVQLGKFGQTVDYEIWNGYVTNKVREHDTYEDPYDCFCTTDSKGNTSCQTCYETRYTVTWEGYTTVGNVRFDHLDRSSRSVYDEPDPVAYKNCVIGEPASATKRYTNYVQAVPESLFHDDRTEMKQFVGKIPQYPEIYGFYRINRVLNVDSKIAGNVSKQINDGLNDELKTLGSFKQVNIVVILTEIDDPSYRFAIEQGWLGGKKNDAVIIVGLDGNKITWSDTITWALNSGNELFNVTMRDGVQELETLDPKTFVPFVSNTVRKLYDRPQMKDYEYLADEIEPPTWVIILALILAFGGSAGLTYYFHKNEI